MTKDERIARLEQEVDRWLEYKPKEGENTFVNAGAIHSLLLSIQLIRDGGIAMYVKEPPESWRK